MLGCAASESDRELRTLTSGRVIEVVSKRVMTAVDDPYLWFEYESSADVPDALLREIGDVWTDVQVDAQEAGVSTVYIDASASYRRLQWDGLWPVFSKVEKGCVSFTQQTEGWESSDLSCCLMGPCEARERPPSQ